MARIRKDPAVRKNEILDAAMALFTSRGFIHVSVADIAREVGIARTTVYEYYTDKNKILIDLADRVAARLDHAVPRGGTPYEKLLSIARDQLTKIDHDRAVYVLLFREAPVLSDAFSLNMKKWRRTGYEAVLSVMKEALDQGEIDLAPEDAAFAFLALVGQRAGDILMADEAIDADAESRRLVDLTWHGISSR